MKEKTIYYTTNNDGIYSCGDIGITNKEWYTLLSEESFKPYIDVLTCFLREKEHTSSCRIVAKKHGNVAQFYNSKITKFAQNVQKYFDRFQLQKPGGNNTYWGIPMKEGFDDKEGFMWHLRDELVEALQDTMMKNLIDTFRSMPPFNGNDETHKWELLNNADKKDTLEIIELLKGSMIVDNHQGHTMNIFTTIAKDNSKNLKQIVDKLFDETSNLNDRLNQYKTDMKNICPNSFKIYANDERTAAAILTCKYPDKYTIYKDELYQIICQFFGFQPKKAGYKYSHFTEIINRFTNKYGDEVQQIIANQINQYKIKPKNLAVQTLFWCMKDYIEEQSKPMQHRHTATLNDETITDETTWYDNVVNILRRRKNIVLYGAPGTGKTYDVAELATRLCYPELKSHNEKRETIVELYNKLKNEKRIVFTTFHQSMDYEDWIEGLRPMVNNHNQLSYEIKTGIFKQLCDEATKYLSQTVDNYTDSDSITKNNNPYIIIIDELNRANVSKIFGEIITLLEADKRKNRTNEESVTLPYSNTSFQIPDNVYIIATMNTADRSLGSLDYAIRRRFAFVSKIPHGLDIKGFNAEIFKKVSELFIQNFDEYKSSNWNQTYKLIPAETLSEEYKPEDVWIGHSYFMMNDENGEDYTHERILYEITPLLEEYIRDGILTSEAQHTIDELLNFTNK